MQDSLNFIESLNDNTIAIINPIITIVGTLIVAIVIFYLGRRYERKDSKKTELSEAKKEFISIFDDSLNTFRTYGKDPASVFVYEMPKHKTAFDKFRATVKRIKGTKTVNRLDEIWVNYYSDNNPHEKFRKQPGQEIGEAKRFAIEAIESVIDFVNKL